MPPVIDPTAYRRWYETPLGSQADADEKGVILALADLRPGERVLDLGCGDGNYTEPIADRAGRAIGLDGSFAMLRAGKTRLGHRTDVRWVQADGARLPFRAADFDVVISVTVLCFAEDPGALLAEAFRILRPGGRIVVGELGRYSLWALGRRLRGFVKETVYRQAHFFSRSELVALLTNAGFRDVKARAAVFYPPVNARAAIRWARLVEPIGRRLAPWAGAFLAASATSSITEAYRVSRALCSLPLQRTRDDARGNHGCRMTLRPLAVCRTLSWRAPRARPRVRVLQWTPRSPSSGVVLAGSGMTGGIR